MSDRWTVAYSTICAEEDGVCEKLSLCLSSLLAMGWLCFKPVGVVLICTCFLVDLFFLRGLILLRGEYGAPFMGRWRSSVC